MNRADNSRIQQHQDPERHEVFGIPCVLDIKIGFLFLMVVNRGVKNVKLHN